MSESRLELAVVPTGEPAEHFNDPSLADEVDGASADDGHHLPGGHELLIAIDGILELRRWGGLGMEPNVLLNPDTPMLPRVPGESTEVAVQRCDCGEVGCGSLMVTITRNGATVRWSDFRDGNERVDIGPFDFDAVEYESELRRAHQDRPWESRAVRIARLVADELDPERGRRPLAFDWATSWSESSVEVSYTDYRPNPKAGQSHRLRGRLGRPKGWSAFSVEPEETSDQYVGSFPIDPNGTDSDAVSDIVGQVHATHPRSWARSQTAADW